MTGPDDPTGDGEEAAVRRALSRTPASAAHDAAILAAADRVGAQIRSRRGFRRWIAPLAAAASVAVFGMWALIANHSVITDDALRGNGAARAISPPEGARLAQIPVRLEWAAVSGATSYEVTLRDAQGAVVGTLSADTTQVDLRLLAAAHFAPGTYFWVVRARGPALDSQLGPFSFRIDAGS